MPRHLPVIPSEDSDDARAAARPRLHWIAIGGGLCVTMWAPLALVATPFGARLGALALRASGEDLSRRLATARQGERLLFAVASAGPVLLSFFAAALASGALVGRFGGRAGPREAGAGGLLAAFLVSLLGLRPGVGVPVAGAVAAFVILSLLGGGGGALGGAYGRRSRR